MYRWLLLLVSIFIFHPGLHAEGDCYVVVEDRMGLTTTAELASLQATACAIREVLPEALQSEFIVIEEGEYLFSTLFDTAKDSLGWDRFRTLSDEHLAFLYISRYVDSKGAYRFKTWLQLPESEDHSCINQGLLNVLAEQVSASMNASDAIAYIEKERDGLKLLRSALDKAYNCCNPTENKSVSYCSSCEYGAESDQENATGFLEYEAMIMSTTVGGPFLLLENLTNIVAVRDTTGNSDLKVEISAEWKWLPGSFMAGSYGLVNLTTELKELQARGGGDINVRSRLFDHTNCAELLSTLANWSTPLSDDSFAAAAYAEELIVLSLGGETRVYSRLRSAYPVLPPTCDLEDDETGTETFTNADGEEKGAVLIPAYIVQQILKRALMGTVGVFIDVGLSVSIEKVFHQLSDECEVNSWGAAWNRYREKASGWQLLITFIDSAVSNDLASIFAGGLGEAVAYLLNSETGGNLKSASEFRVTIFFTKFVKGCATSAVTDVLLRFAKHGKAVITKVKGNDLPPELERQLVRELSALFPFFLKYRERGVRAWGVMFPDALVRVDVGRLSKLSDYLTLKPGKLAEVTNHFSIAKQRNRLTAYLRGLLDRKYYDGIVYRGDKASTTPTQAFDSGISPGGSHDNLIKHLDGGNVNKGDFVSTSKDISIADEFAGNNGYVFKVKSRNSKGVDVNNTLGEEADKWFPEQLEVSMSGGIDPNDIIGAYPKGSYGANDFISNPNYIP